MKFLFFNFVFGLVFCFSSLGAHAEEAFFQNLSDAAIERTQHRVVYDGRYVVIPYPNGDVPDNIGVCSDVVVRSYRALGIDLQKDVHEDMRDHFDLYPKNWGLRMPDPNIDHRRVPNLRVFFSRHGESLRPSKRADDYVAGDIVTWNLRPNGFLPHIGIVTDQKTRSGVPMIVHNIGGGPTLEDILFSYPITGHYRYDGM